MKKRIALIAFALISALVFSSIGIYKSYHPQSQKTEITDYTAAWEKVDSLIAKGLPKSALEIVENIYIKAKTENNSQHFVKAIIYKLRLRSETEEDFPEKGIAELEKEVSKSKSPVKQVLHSMLGELYQGYYQTNRYVLLNRSETKEMASDDIKTWDLRKLVSKTIEHYQKSLESPLQLRQTKLEMFDEIIYKQKGSRKFRSTLYDFLAHRATDYFMNDEHGLSRPAEQFSIDNPGYFAPGNLFVNLKLSTPDTFNLKFYALKTLQELTAFHINDAKKEALIDVELKRLSFVRDNAVLQEKDSLYLSTLLILESDLIQRPASTEITYAVAQHHYRKGLGYIPFQSESPKWELKKAYEYCQKAIDRYPDTDASQNCRSLQEKIVQQRISITTENVLSPNAPSKFIISAKNTNKIYCRVVKTNYNQELKRKRDSYGKNLVNYYLKLQPDKEWNHALEDDGDFQQHRTEGVLPALKAGYYVMLTSSDSDFNYDEHPVSINYFWVSNLSYISRRTEAGNYDFYVFNRTNGKPMQGVKAQSSYRKYDYKSRTWELIKGETYYTNEDGYFATKQVPSGTDSRNFQFDFSLNEDRLVTEDYFYQHHPYKANNKPVIKTFFFTDRSIYRPGQPVYFKGLVMETQDENHTVKAGHSITVTLYDPNGQKVDEQDFTSNDFGTFSGTFTAPSGVLTGQCRIATKTGRIYIQVEEYKRPKFEVSFEPVKQSFKLGEKITVTGKATAYSGQMIDNAEVNFRVIRSVSYPFKGYFWYWFRPVVPETEIVNGTVKTNEKGEFSIEFTAIPDATVTRETRPVFNFKVMADVTDVNGETRTGQTAVAVSNVAMLLDIDIPGKVNALQKDSFGITTTNLSGEQLSASGTIIIYKLKSPDRTLRERKWPRPDRFMMSREESEKLFPFDLYDDELNIYTWQKEKKVLETAFNTEKKRNILPEKMAGWEQGQYIAEISSVDAFGTPVENSRYFTLYSANSKTVPDNMANWFVPLQTEAEPGDSASFIIGTAWDNVKVLFEIELQGKIIAKKWLLLNNEQLHIDIPVYETARGNFAYHLTFVKNSRVYTHSQVINVPYTNKQLDISYETFRDKLKPGTEEEWKIVIRGKNGDKALAEMATAMYDASLDAFMPHSWRFDIYKRYYASRGWATFSSFSTQGSANYYFKKTKFQPVPPQEYDMLNWFDYRFANYFHGYWNFSIDYIATKSAEPTAAGLKKGEGNYDLEIAEESEALLIPMDGGDMQTLESETMPPQPEVVPRRNLVETAFFLPHLQTNEKGEIIIRFTVPESLTRWKILGFAHTKDLSYGLSTKEVITQKELMAIPNLPRFLREGDIISLPLKISNLTDKALTGEARLALFDAISGAPVYLLVGGFSHETPFTCEPNQSTLVSWEIKVPKGLGAVTCRMAASAGMFSDGEESVLPVLTNRMLVTESMPLPVRDIGTKTFNFQKLLNSGTSTTLTNHRLTLEFTSNPAWYAVQALPYLIEYPYECSEQVFSRFYANSLATHIANANPAIKKVFDSWKNETPSSLLSNLEKNQELKSLLLEETPWVMDAKNESERKNKVGLLFDLKRMSHELDQALNKLIKLQASNDGWPWFAGMPDSRYITQHIVTGMGQLDHLGVKDVKENRKSWKMVKDAVVYLDARIREDYDYILRHYKDGMDKNHLSSLQIQYLYARSFFPDIDNPQKDAFDYFLVQSKKYWLSQNKYLQGMIAVFLNRYGEKTTAMDIIRSLKEKAIFSDEMGMYWADVKPGYYWEQAPVETQAILIEAFDEVAGDRESVESMKVWLLKQKQTQDWKTTKATVEACYALLRRGSDWLVPKKPVIVNVGTHTINPFADPQIKPEAGTGYFKTSWEPDEISAGMGKVTVNKSDSGVAWGALYWQYFEDLDKITPHETPLKLQKKLYREINTPTGPVIEQVTETTKLKVGDKLKVRIELRVDRNMEYVHMKDMRASGFEPVNVISGYRYKGGLGYYEATRDAATNFFFHTLPKGTYVFEYPLVINHKGDFSNGITTIQCMYAPEFTSHSEGIRVKVVD